MQKIFIHTSLCKFKKVEICRIKREVNCHFAASIRGVAQGETKRAGALAQAQLTESRLAITDEEGTVIFCGIVTRFQVLEQERVLIQAFSDSWLLDQKVRGNRYFHSDTTYAQVLEAVLLPYGFLSAFAVDGKRPLDTRLIRCEETDWAFLRRLAGKAHTVICSDESGIHGSLLFGISRNQHLTKAHFRICQMRRWEAYTEFVVESETYLHLCSRTIFHSLFVYVYKSVTCLIEGRLIYRYWFRTWEGMPVNQKGNEKLKGIAMGGTVVDVAENQVQVQMEAEADVCSLVTDWFFCRGGEGWYVLPEKGENVSLYFPDSLEEHGYLVRK